LFIQNLALQIFSPTALAESMFASKAECLASDLFRLEFQATDGTFERFRGYRLKSRPRGRGFGVVGGGKRFGAG
jgi:hypothetical protein